MTRQVGVCAIILLAIVECACSRSAAPPPPQPRLTQAAFVRQATAICNRFSARTKPLDRRLKSLSRRRDIEALDLALGEARRPLRMFVFQLSRLRPPARQERRFRQLIHLLNRELIYLNGVYLALGIYDVPTLKALSRRAQRNERVINALSRPLGLRHCGD